jgi:hypothetical protein
MNHLLAVVIATACFSVGCAFSSVDVHPPAALTADAAPRSIPSNARGREVIVVAPFADARPDPRRCGMQMNGWRMDTADVRCDPEPGRWLADAFARRLEGDGYRVLSSEAVPGPSTILVRGSVKQLFLEPYDRFFTRTVEGDFSVHLVVTTGSGLHAERTFYVKGTQTHIGSFESVFQSAADDATYRIARAMVDALGDLLQPYPELGAPEATKAVARTAGGAR